MAYADPQRRRAFDRQRSRRRTAERQAQGLCPRCGRQPPAPGRALCDPCAEKRRIVRTGHAPRNAARPGSGGYGTPSPGRPSTSAHGTGPPNAWPKGLCGTSAAGIPTSRTGNSAPTAASASGDVIASGTSRPGRPGSCMGASRWLQSADTHADVPKQRQRTWRAKGLCIRCGRGRPADGRIELRCNCLEARRIANRQTYAARRAAGLCTKCGTPAFEGALFCGPCSVIEAGRQPRKNETHRARYAERRARWVCTRCGRNPSFGASRCEELRHARVQPVRARARHAGLGPRLHRRRPRQRRGPRHLGPLGGRRPEPEFFGAVPRRRRASRRTLAPALHRGLGLIRSRRQTPTTWWWVARRGGKRPWAGRESWPAGILRPPVENPDVSPCP